MERDEYGRFVPRQEGSRADRGPASAGAYGGESRPWQQTQYGAAEPASCASKSSAATALGVAAGAGIGAALMFLLDPEQGRRRRERLAEAAALAAHRAGEVAHTAWDTTTDAAAGGAAALYAATPSAKEMRRGGRRLWGRTSDAVGSAAHRTRDTAGDWLESAKSYLPSMSSMPSMPHLGGSRRRSHEHDVSTTTAGAGAAGALLLGLGAMWLLDPDRGRGRRAWIGQKTNRLLNETGIACLAGTAFGSYGEGYLRFSYASSEENIRNMLVNLEKFIVTLCS